VRISPKNQMPKAVCKTPLAAELTICVIGLVTFTLNIPATEIKNPPKPVAKVPNQNFPRSVLEAVVKNSTALVVSSTPMRGRIITNVRILEYQARSMTLFLTVARDCLITTTCIAVLALLARPKKIPSGVNPRTFHDAEGDERPGIGRIPRRNPRVTTAHAKRIFVDGREERKMRDARTVKGRTRPRATW
jgi:hypothetical protein